MNTLSHLSPAAIIEFLLGMTLAIVYSMNTTRFNLGETADKVERMTWAAKCSLVVTYMMVWVVVFNIAS